MFETLYSMGFDGYVNRSLNLYEKHYDIDTIGYNMDIIIEIIFRLQIKDKLKESQTIYHSKPNLIQKLQSMEFRLDFINVAIEKYENCTQQQLLSIKEYNIQMIIKILMQLRGQNYCKKKEIINNDKKSNEFIVGNRKRSSIQTDSGDTIDSFHNTDNMNVHTMRNEHRTTNEQTSVDIMDINHENKDDKNYDNRVHLDYHAGYLWKQSSTQKRKWQKRWFVINNGELQYFKTAEKAMNYFKPKGSDKNNIIDLKNRKEYIGNIGVCQVSKVIIDKHKYVLSVTTPSSQRTYLLKAINTTEYDQWFYCLSSQTKRLIFDRASVTTEEKKQDEEQINDIKKKLLIEIQDNNQYCADCNALNPEWVSINLGVIICINCCSIHRSLGSHITKMRSLILDNLDIDTLKYLLYIGGNKKLNKHLLEYNLNETHKINYKTCSLKQRSDFIHHKYINKLYINDNDCCDMDFNQYLYDSVIKNDCFGIIYSLFNEANVNHKYREYNDKTVLQEAILRNHDQVAQLLLNNDAVPILQI